MQQVDFRCPYCAAVFKGPPSLEGECSDCPKCKREVERWPAPVGGSALARSGPPPAPDQAAVWYLSANGKRRGPVTEGQLRSFVEGGSLRPTDMIWKEGMPG